MMMMMMMMMMIVCLCHIIRNMFCYRKTSARRNDEADEQEERRRYEKQTNTSNKTKRERRFLLCWKLFNVATNIGSADRQTVSQAINRNISSTPPPPPHTHTILTVPPTTRLPPKSISGFQNRLTMYTPYRPNTITGSDCRSQEIDTLTNLSGVQVPAAPDSKYVGSGTLALKQHGMSRKSSRP